MTRSLTCFSLLFLAFALAIFFALAWLRRDLDFFQAENQQSSEALQEFADAKQHMLDEEKAWLRQQIASTLEPLQASFHAKRLSRTSFMSRAAARKADMDDVLAIADAAKKSAQIFADAAKAEKKGNRDEEIRKVNLMKLACIL